MKKFTILKIFALSLIMLLGISISLFSQSINLPFQSDFSALKGESVNSSSSMPAITAATMPIGFLFAGSKSVYEADKKIKFGTASGEGKLPTAVINAGDAPLINITIKALAWPNNTAAKDATVILTYGSQKIEIVISGKKGWPVTATDLKEYSIQFDAISTPTSLSIETTTKNNPDQECRMFLGSVHIDGNNTPKVKMPTCTPPAGIYTTPQNITINCETEGATIRYTTNGSTPDETSTVYATPILVSANTTIKAKAWKNDMEPSGIAIAEYLFPKVVTTLLELRDNAPEYIEGKENSGIEPFIYTGEAIVTCIYKQTTYTHSVKYIQDETAAIQIFDRNDAILNYLDVGDKITDLMGTLTNYFGMIELLPTEKCKQTNYYQPVTPIQISLSQLDNNHANPIQAKLIKINNVLFSETGTFETSKFYGLKQNNETVENAAFTQNHAAKYIGKAIPTIAVDITGVCNFVGASGVPNKNRIIMFDSGLVGISDINPSLVQLSPNPANNFVDIVTGSNMKLEIYSIIGNHIATEKLYEGRNTISVSQYPAGVYLLKMTDENNGQLFVQKLVIK
ncbi:MAG: chitobiase/beta-hexosaminidase C-terminal domain-containing protein [Bacteroidales bacterium]|jgi:hypothetical protein|nr:chitobiase/beta-hexosaminidase C-terminal domain-containing protein [Bacteroidales bacterium]